MATIGSSRLYDLIDRFLFPARQSPGATFNVARAEYPAVRRLAEASVPAIELTDAAWLQRVELRGPDRIAAFLERTGFGREVGVLQALFLDDRCGMIRSERVGNAAEVNPDQAVARIMRAASACHAAAIILATHDPTGAATRGHRLRKLTADLYRKGEAIDVFLLDHFVLTAEGWKRLFSFNAEGRL